MLSALNLSPVLTTDVLAAWGGFKEPKALTVRPMEPFGETKICSILNG